jgi:hypothetical protein
MRASRKVIRDASVGCGFELDWGWDLQRLLTATLLRFDQRFFAHRLARLALLPGPPRQAPPGMLRPMERFKQDCGGTAR